VAASVVALPSLSAELDMVLTGRMEGKKRIFDLGFYRACSNREEFTRFMLAHYFLHGALERALAAQPASSAAHRVWSSACGPLRGAPRKLERDLRALGVDGTSQRPSAASAAYVAGVDYAARDGAMLLGHLYGSFGYVNGLLAEGTSGAERRGRAARLAAGLPEGRPEFYRMPPEIEEDRQGFVDSVKAAIDAEGAIMNCDERARAVEGAQAAIDLSAAVYAERPALLSGAVYGAAGVARGLLLEKVLGGASALEAELPEALLPTARRVLSPCPSLD